MEIFDYIIAQGNTICYNSMASKLSYYKTGGKIDTLIKPDSLDKLIGVLRTLDCPYEVVGACTNTLISDKGVRGVVISTKNVLGYKVEGNRIIADCGELLSNITVIARKNSLSGIEAMCGIPGCVGGAAIMNAGAFGTFMQDVVEYVVIWDGKEVRTLQADEIGFGYRNSKLSANGYIVLQVCFNLKVHNRVLIANKMRAYSEKRKASQPNEPSLGSVFKKYNDISAGKYIEDCGLKGLRIGGAEISDKHANFIINNGNSTSEDFYELMNRMQMEVKNKYGIQLEREVKLLGEGFNNQG